MTVTLQIILNKIKRGCKKFLQPLFLFKTKFNFVGQGLAPAVFFNLIS